MSPETDRRGPGRPPAASRATVEQVALSLMLRDGYDAVSVDAIATAAGIGRTTLFRYFGSKAGVIWTAFDETIAWLQTGLDEHRDDDALDAVRRAIVSSTRSALFSSDVWLERFQLLDSNTTLASESYRHWERWRRTLAEHIARSQGTDANDPVPMAVAGACHGVYLAELRNWRNTPEDRDPLLARLDASLAPVCTALRPLLGER